MATAELPLLAILDRLQIEAHSSRLNVARPSPPMFDLWQMSPSYSVFNPVVVVITNPEPSARQGVGYPASNIVSNCQHITFSKFSEMISFALKTFSFWVHDFVLQPRVRFVQAKQSCMANILFRRNPLQVLNSVVRFVAVFMVALKLAFGWKTLESEEHEAVNAERGKPHAANEKRYVMISTENCLRQYSSAAERPLGVIYFPCRHPDAPQIGDFVVRIVNDLLPNFALKFLGGKFLFSHDVNLLHRFTDWSGSFRRRNLLFEPFVF